MPTQEFDRGDDLLAREATDGPTPADYLSFVLGALRRRKRVALGVFVVCLSVLATYYSLRTPLYRAETRILAQRQRSLPSIVRSSVADDQPTRAAWEMIHRRDNLVTLVKSAGLLDAPPKPDLLDSLDAMRAASASVDAPAGEDVERLVLWLDERLEVTVGDMTIDIELDWPDPQQAYRIVEGALQNFLEARHVQEVSALDDAIATLRGRAAVLRDELARAIEEARTELHHDPARVPAGERAVTSGAELQQGREELVRMRSMLAAKERAIADVEEFRRRRLAELLAQYDSRRSVYAEAHPEMVNLRRDIEALTGDSPQISALRAEERQLRADLQARLARAPTRLAVAPASTDAMPRPGPEGRSAVEQSEQVREARRRYEEVMESVNRAELELDAARSAFNLRYMVIWPVQVPKKPVSPKPVKIFGVGGLAALFLAVAAAVALDWRSGKVLERWQVERGLQLAILGHVRDR